MTLSELYRRAAENSILGIPYYKGVKLKWSQLDFVDDLLEVYFPMAAYEYFGEGWDKIKLRERDCMIYLLMSEIVK
jgi:hypothetical protein